MLRTADLDYHLPPDLLATTPAEPRDAARLLVVSRTDPARLEHRTVRDLPEILQESGTGILPVNDLLILNTTRVLPARFRGTRTDTGGGVEGLYLRLAPPPHEHPATWIVLLKMRRARPGAVVRLFARDPAHHPSEYALHLIDRTAPDSGEWIVQALHAGGGPVASTHEVLDAAGLTPLPPYILASRKSGGLTIPDDRDRDTYQTVYAASHPPDGRGSVAAPTAGLHFTPGLLHRLQLSGVRRAECSLGVGLGTFKPVETEFLEQHSMHSERCHIPAATALAIRDARAAPPPRGRIIAVGTTAARTLESFASVEDMLASPTRDTDLLITPGYRFKHIDALLTNFHLPQSTLLALVAAFLAPPDAPAPPDPANPHDGVRRLHAIYAEAIRQRYRFYSYGDAMLILP